MKSRFIASSLVLAGIFLTVGCAKVEVRRTINPDGTGIEEQSVTILENAQGAVSVGLQELLKRKEMAEILRMAGPEAQGFVKNIQQVLGKIETVQSRMQYTSTSLFKRVGDVELMGQWPEDLSMEALQLKFAGMGMGEEKPIDFSGDRVIPLEQVSLVKTSNGGFSYSHRVDTAPVLALFDELDALWQGGKLEVEQEGMGFIIPVVEDAMKAFRSMAFQLQVTLPGPIIKSNSNKVKGRTATWEFRPFENHAKPLEMTAQCGAPAKEAQKDVARYESLVNAANRQRREVVKYLDGLNLDKALGKMGVEFGARRQEGGTKGSLGAIRSAVSIYYGKNEGIYPEVIDQPPFVGWTDENYIQELPMETVTGSRRVQYLGPNQAKEDGDGKGGWLYKKTSGEVWLNLKGQDSKGAPYLNY